MTDDLTCREVTESLTNLIEGTLDSDAEGRIRGHLALCPGCQQYLEQLEETIVLVRTSSLDEPRDVPDDLVRELTAAFLAARTDRAMGSES